MKGTSTKQVTVRLSDDYLEIINTYQGDNLTQRLKNMLDDFKKKIKQVEKTVNDKEKELKRIEKEITSKQAILRDLKSVENYIKWATGYCKDKEKNNEENSIC